MDFKHVGIQREQRIVGCLISGFCTPLVSGIDKKSLRLAKSIDLMNHDIGTIVAIAKLSRI